MGKIKSSTRSLCLCFSVLDNSQNRHIYVTLELMLSLLIFLQTCTSFQVSTRISHQNILYSNINVTLEPTRIAIGHFLYEVYN